MRVPLYPLYLNIELILSDDGRVLTGASGLASSYIGRISIPDGVESIREGTFSACINLTEIQLPASVIVIEQGTFDECVSLTNIDVAKDNLHYMSEEGILYGRKQLSVVRMPIANTKSEVSLPEWVRSVDSWAFCGCSSLKRVDISSVVTEIGYGAFSACSQMSYFRLPNGLTEIKGETFNSCSNINQIIIPEGVRKVGDSAIRLCESLEFLSLPSTLETISFGGFGQCHKLRQVQCHSINPDGISMSKSAFLDMDLTHCILQVPKGMEQVYRDHSVFGLFGLIESVLNVG